VPEIWLIGSNVFRQLMRNRILAVLFLFGLAAVGAAAFLGDLGQEAEIRLSKDFGLLALEWIGFFTVLLCHLVLLFEETELRTISILLVKPIARWHYLSGKLLGSALLLLLNQCSMLLFLWLLSKWRGLTGIIDASFMLAGLYLFLSCLLFSVVVVFFSIYASTVPACAVYASFTFFIGHFTTNLLEWVGRMDQPALAKLVKVLYYFIPNFSLFNLKENLVAVQLLLKGSVADPYAMGGPSTILIGSTGYGIYSWPLFYLAAYGSALMLFSLWRYEHKEY
jgi:ABC-type transport system involved in multi-copper enzyme maturation permease subunit